MTYLSSGVLARLIRHDLGLLRLVLANYRHSWTPFANTPVICVDTLVSFQLGILQDDGISKRGIRNPLGDRGACLGVDKVPERGWALFDRGGVRHSDQHSIHGPNVASIFDEAPLSIPRTVRRQPRRPECPLVPSSCELIRSHLTFALPLCGFLLGSFLGVKALRPRRYG
jgi:hypothetical protein